MNLISLVVMLIIVGVALYLINTYIPMASSIKTILNVVVVIAVCVWLLQAFGLWDGGSMRLRSSAAAIEPTPPV
jgi:undecaprenyl pyrophosphate phosphatase UppP